MRFPRTLFWKDHARSGAENIVELDDPRQTCIIANAGEMMSDARAQELGILEYLGGGGGAPTPQARGLQAAPESPESARGTMAARASQRAHEQLRPLSVEERAYVENAPVAGHQVSAEERATAGQLGAEFTGPTPQEISQAGGDYREASDKAAQAQGATGEGDKSGEAPKPDEPKPPEPEAQGRALPRTRPS